MAGPVLNSSAELIPLPVVVGKRQVLITADGLRSLDPNAKRWMLHVRYDGTDMLPLFDVPKFVLYDRDNRCPWSTGNLSEWLERRGELSLASAMGEAAEGVFLGPNWQGYADELYWAIARALFRHFKVNDRISDNESMLSMALESLMRSHGRI